MTEVIIRDVPIKFPFKPYKVQEDYMSKVIECLQQGVNGVLESPTGTGKTLSLLCASLAWLEVKKAHVQAAAQGLLLNNDSQQSFNNTLQAELQKSTGVSPAEDAATWSDRLAMPQIIYASRTHSQLTQVVKELKRSGYSHVKAAILGSRDQLCLHPDLAQEHGFMKVTMCRAKVSARTCHYYTTLEANKMNKGFAPAEVVDIEDLVKFGTKTKCCPYFLARELTTSADIVFMPYNYLLNPQTRQIQRINLNNAVVILDEAHNVEKMCEESASVRLSSTEIALCMNEVTQVMKVFSDDLNQQFGEETVKDFTLEDLCILKTMFLALEKAVDEIELATIKEEGPNKGKKAGKSFPGSYVFEILSKADIQGEKISVIDHALTGLAQFLSTTSNSPMATKGNMLVHFNEFLKVVYASCGIGCDGKNSDMFYKVYVEPEVPKKAKPDSWSNTNTNTPLNSNAKVINFWCFSPGFAMRSLLKQGIHCVILTSGTLSPLQATISELGIPIPVQLENPHIIAPSQITVNVLNKGPTGEKFISTYINRDNPKYLGDLARMLVNFCRVVPDGVLMFFPSYPVMEKTVNQWQQEGFWSQIVALKPLFVEPQYRDRLGDVMNDYNSALQAEDSRGAVFLAVLRGKVSEGMDFADSRCRAVIVTGLPYPPLKDPRIILKREYVDNLRKSDPKALSGNEWYQLEATRAVNQAVGRVIRHGDDFGAIVLCDCRFESPNITNALSAWVRPHIVKCQEFGPAYGRISKFFKAMGLGPTTRPIQSGASFDAVEGKVRIKEKTEKQVKENNRNSIQEFLGKVQQMPAKASSQPSPSGLFDAIDVSASQSESKRKDILSKVFTKPDIAPSQLEELPVPKKRKLQIVPLKFDSDEASTSRKADSTKTHREYIREVMSRINSEHFELFKSVVKTYAQPQQADYNQTILNLRKVFPDPKTKDLFIGFKRYIKSEHLSQFEELCLRLFGSA